MTIPTTRKMLLGLQDRLASRFDRTLVSHGLPVAPAELLSSVIEVCDDIMAGRTDEMPFAFMCSADSSTFMAKAMSFESGGPRRADGGLGNVVYNKNKIFD